MYVFGLLLLAATAIAQPTVYVARSSIAYPSYRVYLGGVPEVEIIKEPEAKDEPETKLVPEAPVLDPLPIVNSVELEEEEPKEEIIEKNEEELEHKSEQEQKEEVLKEEAPKKEESEEEQKIVIKLEDPKPPSFITSIISALPIKLPSFELPFNLGSFWKPKEKIIRFIPAYSLREVSIP